MGALQRTEEGGLVPRGVSEGWLPHSTPGLSACPWSSTQPVMGSPNWEMLPPPSPAGLQVAAETLRLALD